MAIKFNNSKTIGALRQFLATVCLGPITFGAHISWTSPVLPELQGNSTSEFTITNGEGSWIGSMLALGVLLTAIPSGYLADRFGHKKSVIALVAPTIVFTLIVVFARDVYSLCIARFLTGVAVGGISVIGPMYLSEISDIALRGTLGSFFEFLIYVGVLFVSVCGDYVDYITLTIILGLLTLMIGIIFFCLPENPAHLMRMNKTFQAESALKFYRGDNFNYAELLDEMQQSLEERAKQSVTVKKSLVSKPVIRGLVACVGLTVFQQLCGVDAFIFYSVEIFQNAGTHINAYKSATIVALVQMVSAVIVVFIVEKAGRKRLLYLSTVGTGLSLLIMGVYFHLKEFEINFSGFHYFPLGSFIVYSFAFAVGLGPVPWMVNGELFSHDIKGVANGITISTNWIFLFIVTKTFPIAMVDLGPHYTFYAFAICMLLCLVFIKFCVPETRGKSLEQIQKELNS